MTTICVPTLQAALPSLPTESPVWVDLTHLLRGFTSQRGAQGADAAVSAGVSDHTLDNRDRNLDPDYAGGKWHTWLDLSKRVRRGVTVGESPESWAGAVMSDNPVAVWALNEPSGVTTAYDQAGGVTGRHGTHTGGVALGQAGLVGTSPDTAAAYDGSNDYTTVPHHASLNLTTEFTIEALVSKTADASFQRIVAKGVTGTAAYYLIADNTGKVLVGFVDTGGAFRETTPVALPLNTTTHLMGVKTAAQLILYVNGVAAATSSFTQTVRTVAGALGIGADGAGGSHWNGRIGWVALYNRGLSASRAAAHSAASQGTHYERFHGEAERLPQELTGFQDAYVPVPCVEMLAHLAEAPISGSRPQERSDQRIAAILELSDYQVESGWILDVSLLGIDTILGPVSNALLDVGSVEVQAAELSGNALPAIQEVERSEHGRFFQTRSGDLAFHSRTRRLLAGGGAPAAVFGDRPDAGELPYAAAPHDYDVADIKNIVSVTRVNGTEQRVEDGASRTRYRPRTLPPYSVTLVTDDEARSVAEYQLYRRKARRPVLRSLVLNPDAASGGLWPELHAAIFSRDLFDVIEVRKRPPGGGDPLVFVCEITGIRETWAIDAQGSRWEIEWTLAEADRGPYWVLEAPDSQLGITTRLGF